MVLNDGGNTRIQQPKQEEGWKQTKKKNHETKNVRMHIKTGILFTLINSNS